MRFTDREDAGLRLADKLLLHPKIVQSDRENLLVLSIPRGGVVLGDIVANTLNCQHDVVVVKKIGLPGREELAIGAITEDGRVFLDNDTLAWSNPNPEELRIAITHAKAKVTHYVQKFRKGQPLNLKSKTVILIDDGVATGETMKAALQWTKSQNGDNGAKAIIVAVPVCSPTTEPELKSMADDLIVLDVPQHFAAVGQFYEYFDQVTDEEVLKVLDSKRTIS